MTDEITLDGKPWPVTRPVNAKAGQRARVALPMDEDRFVATRRWTTWKPWVTVAAGVTIVAVGAALERRAFANRDAVLNELACDTRTCDAIRSGGEPAALVRF